MAPNPSSVPGAAPGNVRGDVEVALDALGDKFVSAPIILADGRTILLHSATLRLHEIAALNPVLPDHVIGSEVVIEEDSFIAYVLQFASSTAVCKASLAKNQIEAVLDYHGRAREGGEAVNDGAVPQRLAHKATLQCPYDLDYAKWKAVFGKPLEPKTLAYFVEDMIHTIGTPPAADLLEAVNDFKLERVVRFKTARSDRSGTISFGYEETDVEGGGEHDGTIKLPQEIEIIVPIFQGGNPIQLKAKLRYVMDKGKLSFILAVAQLDKIERDTFRNIGERVARETKLPVFYTN
jgi:Uncharacterized conserved protein (DUF2303)